MDLSWIGAAVNRVSGEMHETRKHERDYNESNDRYNTERDDALEDWRNQTNWENEMWNKTNQYNEQMWNKQNAYNEERWRIQNEYDSPAAQMARFKEAGINPNAMFGHMSGGANISSPDQVKASAPSGSNIRGAQGNTGVSTGHNLQNFDLNAGLLNSADIQLRQAQVNNLQKAQEVADADIALKGLQASKQRAELPYASELAKTSLQALEQQVKRNTLDYLHSENDEQRKQATHSMSLIELSERINNARRDGQLKISERENLELDKQIKRYEIMLNKQGIQKNDMLPFRIIAQQMPAIKKFFGKDGTFYNWIQGK